MKRKVAVCVGVMVAVAGGVAGAEEPAAAQVVAVRAEAAPSVAPVTVPAPGSAQAATAPQANGAPAQAAPAVAGPVTVMSPAPLVNAATGGEPAQAAGTAVVQRSESEEIRVPAVLMLMPHMSTAGTDTGRVVTTFAVGLLATHAKRVDGLAMALGANWVGESLSGGQLAVGANVARGCKTTTACMAS